MYLFNKRRYPTNSETTTSKGDLGHCGSRAGRALMSMVPRWVPYQYSGRLSRNLGWCHLTALVGRVRPTRARSHYEVERNENEEHKEAMEKTEKASIQREKPTNERCEILQLGCGMLQDGQQIDHPRKGCALRCQRVY